MKKQKKWFFLVMGFVVILAGIFAYIQWSSGADRFICSYPDYARLSDGMAKSDVEEILGKPAKQILAGDETQNFYCPGFGGSKPRYNQAAQCWQYQFRGWLGSIDLYFDKEDILIGKGCGTG